MKELSNEELVSECSQLEKLHSYIHDISFNIENQNMGKVAYLLRDADCLLHVLIDEKCKPRKHEDTDRDTEA